MLVVYNHNQNIYLNLVWLNPIQKVKDLAKHIQITFKQSQARRAIKWQISDGGNHHPFAPAGALSCPVSVSLDSNWTNLILVKSSQSSFRVWDVRWDQTEQLFWYLKLCLEVQMKSKCQTKSSLVILIWLPLRCFWRPHA